MELARLPVPPQRGPGPLDRLEGAAAASGQREAIAQREERDDVGHDQVVVVRVLLVEAGGILPCAPCRTLKQEMGVIVLLAGDHRAFR